jgi:hypothetical protein
VDDRPDELMIAWGDVPDGTRASVYLPTVDAAVALDWAHRMYVSNRLSLVDDHTLACEAGGVTFIPVPGTADLDHVGLLAVELPPTVHKGERYSVRIRQLTGAAFGEGRRVEVAEAVRRRRTREAVGAVDAEAAVRSFESVAGKGFQYRRTIGAFGLEIPVSTKTLLLAEEERTLSILRHIELSVPVETTWWPVFRRYVGLYAGRVAGLGGDPTIIVPTGDGDWRHPEKWHGEGPHRGDEWDECRPSKGDTHPHTGKIVALEYDHFGDFTGFVIETAHDAHVLVRSREERVERLARDAWTSRAVVRAWLLPDDRLEALSISGHPDA